MIKWRARNKLSLALLFACVALLFLRVGVGPKTEGAGKLDRRANAIPVVKNGPAPSGAKQNDEDNNQSSLWSDEAKVLLQRLIDRERQEAVVIETMPYPKMQSFVVAVPRLSGELRAQVDHILQSQPGESSLGSELKDYLDYNPIRPDLVGRNSPSGACAWRIIWVSLYDEENAYRFQVIDTDSSPEDVFSYLPSGLLSLSTSVNTRPVDISLEQAHKRYGHLFRIEEEVGDGHVALKPLLEGFRTK